MPICLPSPLREQLPTLARTMGADRLVLFGSRARGDHRPGSDVDLAVWGLDSTQASRLRIALEDLPTLLEFDLVNVTDQTDPALLRNIERDGVVLMDKFQEKYSKLCRAVDRLEESLSDYARMELDSIRDGAIQRFEFSTELAWKTLREYLQDQGYVDLNSPKTVMRKAYAVGFLPEEDAWVRLIEARNQTSHIYDEETAQRIFAEIRDCFAPMLRSLTTELGKREI